MSDNLDNRYFDIIYLVFWVDEAIIECLSGVGKVEDTVDPLSGVDALGGGDLAHALELHAGHVHAERGHAVHVVLLRPAEAQDVEGLVHDLHLLSVVDGLYLDLAHGHQGVEEDVVRELALLAEINLVGDHEVEDVV